ncbi:MAG: CheR family methyltransferase [Gaiellaceae bacterium]
MATSTRGEDLEPLLEFLKEARGLDFTGYKRPSLQRRIEKRMQAVRAESYLSYRAYLESHPDEFVELFNTILINVTAFFRDPPVWDYLRREVVPQIVAEAEADSIRVWTTGCASGEETYSLAMCFAEALPENELGSRLKIYATDIDEEALGEARHGSYTPERIEAVPTDLRERYLERLDQRWMVVAPLRRAVIFGRHDIVQDPPISRIDLLTSRNTLMYFTPDAQRRIVANFHFALQPGGYLILGKSEMMLGRSPLFTPVELKHRVFRKALRGEGWAPVQRARPPLQEPEEEGSMRDAGFETGPVAQLIVDGEGNLSLANLQARTLFNLAQRDVGRPLRDLEVSYKPVELRSQIERAYSERHAVALRDIQWTLPNGQARVMDVQVAPLFGGDGGVVGVGISFIDMTRHKRLQEAVEHSKRDVEAAYAELQSTSEELETTNEELQSTNEELETTNEELQSSNEELETMNEELQSTNEELQTINDELNQRTDDLNQMNSFLGSILSSLNDGVVVLDEELRVRAWNDRARALWGLLADEVQGRHFMNLDIGLPVDRLRGSLRAGLAGDSPNPVVVEAKDRRGRAISCRVRIAPVGPSDNGGSKGVILFMESSP